MPISEEQKSIVRSTAPILKENGKEITSIFYKELFAAHPALLDLFNQTNQKIGTQPLALANTVYFAAENIDHLEVLLPQVKLIAHKHRALMVRPEHYPIVGKYLLFAISEFLGDKATKEILDAWAAAYDIIATIFINVEQELYNELGADQGFIPFVIVKKEELAKGPIVSLSLERRDGGKLHPYQPGQYLTVRIKKDGHFHNRHYSLIRPFDGQTYSIAIKEEIDREPHGVVSTEIIDRYQQGDTISASLPAGTFALVDNPHGDHLFIAGRHWHHRSLGHDPSIASRRSNRECHTRSLCSNQRTRGLCRPDATTSSRETLSFTLPWRTFDQGNVEDASEADERSLSLWFNWVYEQGSRFTLGVWTRARSHSSRSLSTVVEHHPRRGERSLDDEKPSSVTEHRTVAPSHSS